MAPSMSRPSLPRLCWLTRPTSTTRSSPRAFTRTSKFTESSAAEGRTKGPANTYVRSRSQDGAHRQGIPWREGSRRRQLRGARERGSCAGGGERRGEIDADESARRRLALSYLSG